MIQTDIVGSTRLFGRLGDQFRPMMARHDAIFRECIARHASDAFLKGTGDGFYAVFASPMAALCVAEEFRAGLVAEQWARFVPTVLTGDVAIRSRIGLHFGEVVVLLDGDRVVDVEGQARDVAEGLQVIAHPNQVLATHAFHEAVCRSAAPDADASRRWTEFGDFRLRDVPGSWRVWGIDAPGDPPAPAPIQAQDIRTIVFAILPAYADLAAREPDKLATLRDQYEAAVRESVARHQAGAFTKRLPDGTLAAFKTAADAVRFAIDLRRAAVRLAREHAVEVHVSIGVDRGPVTFEYVGTQIDDVRDLPVHRAAKIAKAPHAAVHSSPSAADANRLLLTRAARDAAWEAMDDRDSFKWESLPAKRIPGETDPLDLAELLDVQVNEETRSVLWVDALGGEGLLGQDMAVFAATRTRLVELARSVLASSPEQPVVQETDYGLVAIFESPAPAVKAAQACRRFADHEEWEKKIPGFTRKNRRVTPARLAVHHERVVTSWENGQLTSIRGPGIDGVRGLAEQVGGAQVLATAQVRAALSAGMGGSIRWRRVRLSGDAAAAAPDLEVWEILRGNRYGRIATNLAIAASLAGAFWLTFVLARGEPDRITLIADARLQQLAIDAKRAISPESVDPAAPATSSVLSFEVRKQFSRVLDLVVEKVREAERSDAPRERLDGLADELARVESLAGLIDSVLTPTDGSVLERDHLPALAQAESVAALETWLSGAADYNVYTNSSEDEGMQARIAAELRSLGSELGVLNLDTNPDVVTLKGRIANAESALSTLRNSPRIERDRAANQASLLKLRAETDGLTEDARDVIQRLTAAKEETNVRQRVRGEVIDLFRRPITTTSDWEFLNQAWDRYGKFAMAALEAPSADPRAVRDQATAVRDALAAFETSLAPPPPPDVSITWRDRYAFIGAWLGRDIAATFIPRLVGADGTPNLADAPRAAAEAKALFSDRVAELVTLVGTLDSVENALDLTYGLDETPEGGTQTIRESVQRIQDGFLLDLKEVRGSVSDVLDRVDALERIARLDSLALIQSDADSARVSNRERVVAAWNRAGDPSFYADSGWLDFQLRLAERVRAVADGLPDAARRGALIALLEQQLRARWVAYVSSSRTTQQLRAASSNKTLFLIRAEDLSLLPPESGLDLSTVDFVAAMQRLSSQEAVDEQAREETRRYVERLRAFPADHPRHAQAQIVAARLNELLSPNLAQPVGPEMMGPAIAGWRVASSTADRVVYEAPAAARAASVPAGDGLDPAPSDASAATLSASPVRIEFVRLSVPSPAGEPRVVFVARTEVSLGLFTEAVSRAGQWNAMQGWLEKSRDDQRKGPFVWEWPARAERLEPISDRSRTRLGWVKLSPLVKSEGYYPPGVTVAPPDASTPMQNLSPAAAAYFAHLLHCRLPTAEEWAAAAALDSSQPAARNVPDASFARVVEHVRNRRNPQFMPPADGAFIIPRADEAPASAEDDSWVWFAPVDWGADSVTFPNIVGNVAEYVFNDPDLLDGLAAAKEDQVDAALRSLGKDPAQLGVLGGSALVLPADPARQYPCTGRNKAGLDLGYPDVGFRLAFTQRTVADLQESFTIRAARVIEDLRLLGDADPSRSQPAEPASSPPPASPSPASTPGQ